MKLLEILTKVPRKLLIGIIGVVAFMYTISYVETVSLGYVKVYQNTLTKSTKVYKGPDWYISAPLFGSSYEYKQVTTLTFKDTKEDEETSYNANSLDISFADTYKAKLPMSARFDLPQDDMALLKLHTDFRGYDNLVHSLYVSTMRDIATNVSKQFTAEEVFQGGLNSLKSSIEDQSKYGIVITERRQVQSISEMTERVPLGTDKTKSVIEAKPIMVWKAIPKTDKSGNVLRTSNPLSVYKISVTQINLFEPQAEARLEQLLTDKKVLVAKKISSVQKQENAKTEIETAKLEGEAERTRAEQKRMIEADAAIIEKKKEVELAKQQANREIVDKEKEAKLAIIEKQKELQIAQSNKAIEEANSLSAIFAAKAIREKGLAEAAVKEANYNAINEGIFAKEVEKEIQLAKYLALKEFKVAMPTTVIGGGTSNGNLDALTNLHILDKVK